MTRSVPTRNFRCSAISVASDDHLRRTRGPGTPVESADLKPSQAGADPSLSALGIPYPLSHGA